MEQAWYKKVGSLVEKPDEEEKIAIDIYNELIKNPMISECQADYDELIKSSIVVSYKLFTGRFNYEERRDFVVGTIFVSFTFDYLNETSKYGDIDATSKRMCLLYKNSKFLDGDYQNENVYLAISEITVNCLIDLEKRKNYTLEENNIRQEIALCLANECDNENELIYQVSVANTIYKKLSESLLEENIGITEKDILEALYDSYTYIIKENDEFLSYKKRYDLVNGLVFSKFLPANKFLMCENMDILFGEAEDPDPYLINKYFIYGLIVRNLTNDEVLKQEINRESESVIAGKEYFELNYEQTNLVLNIAENIGDYYNDECQKTKNPAMVLGIIEGALEKRNYCTLEYKKQS